MKSKRKISKIGIFILSTTMLLQIAGCGDKTVTVESQNKAESAQKENENTGSVIELSDDTITVDGKAITSDTESAVYAGAEIIYYKEGQPETYGAGTESEEHSEEEAKKHTVVTITQPGTYTVTGTLSAGQIAVDLGEEAKEDPEAVVNLVLDNVDISCSVAPAIIVYNVYECGSDDVENASQDVDTENAGFNLILQDGSENKITGSHVAKIYKDGTTTEEIESDTAKKAHKYDAAIESQMSFNICAGSAGDGRLTVYADNEGIESSLHMTIKGGNLEINANDDSLNAGEDKVSVITINGGTIICDSGYQDGDEGDGIDSNGWIVMNDGYVIACANAKSQDSGVDSDMGVYINGGTLLASGHMYDEISNDSKQAFKVFSFDEDIKEGEWILIKDDEEKDVAAFYAANDYSIAVFSGPQLEDEDYTLYKVTNVTGEQNGSICTQIDGYEGAEKIEYSSEIMRGGFGKGGKIPQGAEPPDKGERPEGMKQLPREERPEGTEPPQ